MTFLIVWLVVAVVLAPIVGKILRALGEGDDR